MSWKIVKERTNKPQTQQCPIAELATQKCKLAIYFVLSKGKRKQIVTCFPSVQTTYGSLDSTSRTAKFVPLITLTFNIPINSTMPSCDQIGISFKAIM